MATETIRVPDIGSDGAVDVIEIPVAAGDSIAAEQTIVVLESDKASVEVPAPRAGKVAKVLVAIGDRVGQGDPLLELEQAPGEPVPEEASRAGSAPEPAPRGETPAPRTAEAVPEEQSSPEPAPAAAGAAGKDAPAEPRAPAAPAPAGSGARAEGGPSRAVHAGPAVRKLSRELGVDLAEVRGSGPAGRILKDDVHAWVKTRLSSSRTAAGGLSIELPDIDFSRFGKVERVELGRIRKATASNLHRSWLTIPHVTQHDDADITELEEFRQQENRRLEKQGVKLTMLAFMAKACASALREFPDFNSSLEKSGEALIRKNYIHVGVAVDTADGLVVPVLRDVDSKGIVEIARELAALAEKARARKLVPGDMQGASFSISSLGGIGGTAFTPIVNWPEVAILGVSKSRWTPCWNGREFVPRLMLPLSLSYDHRVIDGALAARFSTFLSATLADMRRALL